MNFSVWCRSLTSFSRDKVLILISNLLILQYFAFIPYLRWPCYTKSLGMYVYNYLKNCFIIKPLIKLRLVFVISSKYSLVF